MSQTAGKFRIRHVAFEVNAFIVVCLSQTTWLNLIKISL